LVLFDDGFHGDNLANDGLYANYFTNTMTAGNYSFTVKASGSTQRGGPFYRESSFSTYINTSSLPWTPILMTPPNGTTGVNDGITLKWTSQSALSYYVQVSPNQLFVPTLVDTNVVGSDSLVLRGMSPNTTYFWRVNASNGSGTTDWSPVWRFSTAVSTDCSTDWLVVSPNPFVPALGNNRIEFGGTGISTVESFNIYNKAGELVKTLKPTEWTSWDGKSDSGESLASGVYIWVATEANGKKEKGKFAIIR
jgi:hypothetical protein